MSTFGHLQRPPLKHRIEYNLQRHFISVIITFICILLFIGYILASKRGTTDTFVRLVAPTSDEIRDGRLWGLFTCNLLESNLLWLFFSLSWLWKLGGFIEQRVNSFFYLWLIISSAIFASSMEIAVFGSSSYGFAALTYSMFGFILVRSLFEPLKWKTNPDVLILLLIWVVIGFVVSYTGIYKISYGAIASVLFGFIWGSLLAFLVTHGNRIWLKPVPLLLLGLCVIPIFWAPWSIPWLSHKAHTYHARKDYGRAKSLYMHILEKDPNDEDAKVNFQLIQVFEMAEEAYKLYSDDKFSEAKAICLDILKIDPNHEWAKDTLKDIQVQEMYEEAHKLYSDNKFSEAKAICLDILKIDPNHEGAKEVLQNLHIWEMAENARNLYLHYKFSEAKAVCLDILKIDPNDEWAKKLIARLPVK